MRRKKKLYLVIFTGKEADLATRSGLPIGS